jgi:hypothetical protein
VTANYARHAQWLSQAKYYHVALSCSKHTVAVLWCAGLQHPSGGLKQVALRENQLIRKGPSTLLYRSDTAPGSSGSPCFNDDWQVRLLHTAA